MKKMKKKINERGFTLVESLIVLSVFMLIVSLAFLPLKNHQQSLEKQKFFHTLQADLLYAQQYAITTQKRIRVNFVTPQNKYDITDDNRNRLVSREIPSFIRIGQGTLGTTFYFLSSGNISKFGSIYFFIDDEQYKLTYQIGRGRFYVEKL